MAEAKIEIPAAPAGLPPALEKRWKAAYEAAFKEAQDESPDDLTTQRQLALREANRLLKTPELESYEQVMKLEEHHFVLREPSTDGKTLRVVTRHGKKYKFPIPAKSQKPAGDDAKNSNGGTGTSTT